MPSSSSNLTSEGTSRMLDVIGATVAVDKYPRALSRVSTTTGLALSGGAKWYRRISPLAVPPPKSPPFPNGTDLLNLVDRLRTLGGPVVPVPGSQGSSGGPGAPLELARSDSTSFAVLRPPQRVGVSNRGRPGSFPYVDPTTQCTRQARCGTVLGPNGS